VQEVRQVVVRVERVVEVEVAVEVEVECGVDEVAALAQALLRSLAARQQSSQVLAE
jgi:hypothetical protein